IEHAITKGYLAEEIVFPSDAFEPKFQEMLQHDKQILEKLNKEWQKQHDDPKYNLFISRLPEFFDPNANPTGKLVIFSESVDTLNYLFKRLTQDEGRSDVLLVTAANRRQNETLVKENFDAKYAVQDTRYNIILTSDVLAEGVNLHRSNVIVNYDSPWNATRLIQRIGRVNRIGSVAPHIYNYMFYPSKQGDDEIQLYRNALVKLQGFHSAFGEDAKIYSREEIVHEFQLFDSNVKDSIDKKIALLREVRELYNSNRQLYHKIKSLPMKSRVIRETGKHVGQSIVFVSSTVKTEFYHVKGNKAEAIDFIEAMNYLKAKPEERGVPLAADSPHYQHVNCALQQYTSEYVEAADTSSVQSKELDKSDKEALKFLRTIKQITTDHVLQADCSVLMDYVTEGIYNQLVPAINKKSRQYKGDKVKMKQDEYRLQVFISQLIQEYQTQSKEQRHEAQDISDPQIIISETFQ
ncbi:MAG: C-terminal helicase domain-containing protein, partial [Bacteroides sp.]